MFALWRPPGENLPSCFFVTVRRGALVTVRRGTLARHRLTPGLPPRYAKQKLPTVDRPGSSF
eukprot:5762373-Pyramimonas_sp.AAC.1